MANQSNTTTASNPFLGGITKSQNGGSAGFGPAGFGSPSFGAAGFGKASGQPKPAQSPFTSANGSTVFGKPSESKNPANNPFMKKNDSTTFGKASEPKQAKKPFGQANNAETKRKGRGFQDKESSASEGESFKRKGRGDAVKKQNGQAKPLPNGAAAAGKQAPFGARQDQANNATTAFGSGPSFGAAPTDNSKPPTELQHAKDPFAKKVYQQLHDDGISPPPWPSQPGNPKNKAAMAKFREQYEDYRAKVRASLTNAGLIDDPNKRRRLDEAIDFRGICQDMCPEYEKITRITEFDVVQAEKGSQTKTGVKQRMVKKLARSAAGQEAPLPMDVRSVPTLRDTLDYLINDLLHDDDNLPAMHNFLWDRTRAIRRDFTFFSSLKPDELQTQVYVLENIARFHVTSLHLLSRSEITPEGFVEQQEKEQLGKALLSLRDLYEDCGMQGIKCDNEAEFRAYYLLFHASDPNIMEVLQRQWKPWLWKESDEVRTAVSLVEALQNTRDFYGPLRPAPTLAAAGPIHSYFRIVEDPSVSYTMACFAEIHFSSLRNSVLSALAGALGRPKAETKDVTAGALNDFLRFDTVDEAISYAEKTGLEFEDDDEHPGDSNWKRLVLNHKQPVDHVNLPHQFSEQLVERKRGGRSLSEVIHSTVSGGAGVSALFTKPTNSPAAEGSLFVDGNESKNPNAPAFSAPSPFGQPAAPSQNGFPASSPSWNFSANAGASTQTQPTPGAMFSKPPSQPAPGSMFANTASQPASSSPFGGFQNASLFKPANNESGGGKTSETVHPGLPAATDAGPKTIADPPTQNGIFPQSTSPFNNPSATASGPATNKPSLFETKPPSFSLPPSSSPFTFPSTTPAPQPSSTTFPTTTTTTTPTFSFPPASASTSSAEETKSAKGSEEPASSTLPETTKSSNPSLMPAPKFSLQPPAKDKSSAINPSPLRFSVNASPTPSSSSTVQSGPEVVDIGPKYKPAPGSLFAEPPAPASAPGQPAKLFQPAPKRDYMGDFTKWFLLGDKGLLDEFKIFMLDEILGPLHAKFEREQREKREKEEEDANNEKAENWRVYNLRLKFFYRWKRNAREKRQRFLRRSGRDQMREFWRQAELEKKEKRAREEEKQKAAQLAVADRPAEFREMLKRRRTSSRQTADELLASGVLSGIPNEREAIADIVYSGTNSPAASSVADGSSIPSSAKLAKKEGSKTRALREELLGKPSRKSLPAVFARRSASPASTVSQTPTASKVSERWRLKAMGFVKMPDGTVLREDMADQYIYGGKKYPGLGSASNRSSSLEGRAKRASFGSSTSSSRLRASSYSMPAPEASLHRSTLSGDQTWHRKSVIETSPSKRKRADKEEGGEGDDVSGETPPHKRTVSDLLDMAHRVRNEHKEIRGMLDEMLDQDKEYYREASERLGSEAPSMPSRGGTPWRVSGGVGV